MGPHPNRLTGNMLGLRDFDKAFRWKQWSERRSWEAPTGIAALHIHGSTYHSALGISSKEGKGKAAAGRQLTTLQDDWKHIRYMIINEKSIVGRVGLALIDKRLREISSHMNVWFGGLSVILCGDFGYNLSAEQIIC